MRAIFLTIYLICLYTFVPGQPPTVPCNVQAGEHCFEYCADIACLVCDLSSLNSYPLTLPFELSYNGPTPLCYQDGYPHNPLWIAFMANGTSINILFELLYCDIGNGIQAVIYDYIIDCDFQSYPTPIACSVIPCNTNAFVLNAAGLIPGNIYYLMIDGCNGDVCTFAMNVWENGQFAGHGLPPIYGPQEGCVGSDLTFTTINYPSCPINYFWTLDGMNIDQNYSDINLWFTEPGTYELCLETSYSCIDANEENCITIEIFGLDTILLDTVFVCPGGNYTFLSQEYPPGNYLIFNNTELNCDTLFNLIVAKIQIDTIFITYEICRHDTVFHNGIMLLDSGLHVLKFPSLLNPACDSLIFVQVKWINFQSPNLEADDELQCSGDTIYLHVTPNFKDIQWFASGNQLFLPDSNNQRIRIWLPGRYDVAILSWSTDSTLVCRDSAFIEILPPAFPPLEYDIEPINCITLNGIITILHPASYIIYEWFDEAGAMVDTGATLNVTEEGNYSLVRHSHSGCRDTTLIFIEANLGFTPVPEIVIDTLNCALDSGSISLLNHLKYNAYYWQSSNGAPNYSYEYFYLDPEVVWLYLTDIKGCRDSFIINLPSNVVLPEVDITLIENGNCSRDPFQLFASGSPMPNQWSFHWTGPVNWASDTNPSLPIPGLGVYLLTVFDSLSECHYNDSIYVIHFPVPPQIELVDFHHPSCYNANDGYISIDSVSFGTPPFAFILNGVTQTFPYWNNLSAGQYLIEVVDSHDCLDTILVELVNPIKFQISCQPKDTLISAGDNVKFAILQVSGEYPITTVNFEPNNGLALNLIEYQVSPLKNTVYLVTSEDQAGCITTDSCSVSIINYEYALFVPNVFSPKGNVNTTFYVPDQPLIEKVLTMKIYDCWGNLIYEQIGQGNEMVLWDGIASDGKDASIGVYIYVIDVILGSGAKTTLFGDILVMD